jgi:hypothetical protein
VEAAASEPRPGARASAWRWLRSRTTSQVSAAIAVIALLIGLAFNSLNVRDQTQQERRQAQQATEQRIAAEISLLTQLNQQFTAVSQQLGLTHAPAWFCDGASHGLRSLPAADEGKLFAALNYYDYLAWLINHNRIRYDPARRYMRGEMLQTLGYGDRFFGRPIVAVDFPELVRYQRTAAPHWKPLACA